MRSATYRKSIKGKQIIGSVQNEVILFSVDSNMLNDNIKKSGFNIITLNSNIIIHNVFVGVLK